jgi:Spy/CpxP family protein refolding chaperone
MRVVPALAVVLLASAFVVADETPTKTDKKPTAAAKADKADKAEAKPVRLTKPWKDLTSLTEDQKRQIAQIHRKAVDETKAIEQREKADIMALLSDQQKAELAALQEKDSAEKKAKAGQKSGKPAGAADKSDAAKEEAKASQKAQAGSN